MINNYKNLILLINIYKSLILLINIYKILILTDKSYKEIRKQYETEFENKREKTGSKATLALL